MLMGQPGYNPNMAPPGGPPGAAMAGAVGAASAEPSAPPLDKMDTINGYNNLAGSVLPPPTYVVAEAPPDRQAVTNLPSLTEEAAREALMEHVSQHCCYGKKPAQEMKFLDIKTTSAFHYTLESFTETRSTAWVSEPYTGQPVDGPMNGMAPGPWEIQMHPQQKFKDSNAQCEVPHTASVKPCHACIGLCRVRCNHCEGGGRTFCSTCEGTGQERFFQDGSDQRRRCTRCHGDGRRACDWCHGHGQIACRTCNAKGQLKCYIKLTVKWLNHFEDHIVERTALPDELIRGVTGQTAFEEELPMIWPINHFPDQTINIASKQLVDRHRQTYANERMLLQRHRVRIVPVTEAIFQFREKQGSYFVYGFENKVHAPAYPQKCCCGCVIL